jgi:hypothetical protein
MNIIPIFSTLLAFAFAAAVLNRWRHNRAKHNLLWGAGLLLYGLGTLCEVVLSLTFSALVLKVWYLTGAMLTAAWLGQGTLYLLVRKRRVADGLMLALGLASLVCLLLVLFAPVNPAAAAAFTVSRPVTAQYKEILGRSGLVILFTVLLNVYGTFALVGGAIYSAFLFWRKQVLANRMLGNLLIAAGALLPAFGGSFLRAGFADLLYLSEFLGALLMYAGFILATSGKPVESQAARRASAG